MSVAGVGQEELPLCGHGSANVLLPINVFLTAVHHTNVACTQKVTNSHFRIKTSDPLNSLLASLVGIITSSQWQELIF